MKLILAVLMFSLAPQQTWGLPFCGGLLTRSAADEANLRSNLNEIFAELRSLELTALMAPIEDGRIEIVFEGKRWPGQADVTYPRMFKRRKLIIRKLEWTGEKARQMAIWQVARAIYVIETRKRLWSAESLFTKPGDRELDVSMSGPDGELPAYFAFELPHEWRDEFLKRTHDLDEDIYTLIMRLDHLDPAEILPKSDPGRHWIAMATLGLDASKRMFPNQKDFEVFRAEGPVALRAATRERHSRSVLVNYYLDHLRRATLAGLIAAPFLVAAPYVLHTPQDEPPAAKIERSVPSQNLGDGKTGGKGESQLSNRLERERLRLERALREEQGKLYPDLNEIDRLKRELREITPAERK
ncbi:MAG: hypothetical protein HC902_01740 [Calothrix sp. SM1_5_4]|nr:hypothetical protein [Calothrix sp. SM1_5_4]